MSSTLNIGASSLAQALAGPSISPGPWPDLREELRLHPSSPDAQGQPTWTLQDPVRHRFLRIDWTTFEVLSRWWLADPRAIAEQVGHETTLQIGPEDVMTVLQMAVREELVHPTQPPASPAHAAKGLRAGLTWLLHHYLFFRIPLVRPDRALGLGLPWVQWLGGAAFARWTLLAFLIGLWGVTQQTERLGAQWLDLISWRGLALYGLTLGLVKVAHELGHAFVAKAQGLRVPTMGVAFMVLWPVAYTDTTEAWKLADPRARWRIAAAGVRTELTLAAWSTLAWAALPDGPLRTATFVVATMTWVSSVLINLSPFMRFDGYFLLCDALDQANLHERSFAMLRWALRKHLLGWQTEAPETLTASARNWMLAFGAATLGYRLVLYLGIAWTVYHFGFKALGLFLFAVELGWFIVGPVARELRQWHAGRSAWMHTARVRRSAAGLVALAGAACIPWSASAPAAALVQPTHHLALRLPQSVTIEQIPVQIGQTVRAGAPLLRTLTPELQRERDTALARLNQLDQELATAAVSPDQQARWASLQAGRAAARDQVSAIEQELARLQPLAPFDAIVVDLHPELRAGQTAPPPREVLMHLAATDRWSAVAYADETSAQAIASGLKATIVLDAQPHRQWTATVRSVAPHPSSSIAEPQLVRTHGGLIEAQQSANGSWTPSQALYRVELDLDATAALPPRQWRGHVVFKDESRSLWTRLWQNIGSAWVREAGF